VSRVLAGRRTVWPGGPLQGVVEGEAVDVAHAGGGWKECSIGDANASASGQAPGRGSGLRAPYWVTSRTTRIAFIALGKPM
jgi:hypothetical protein